MPDPSWIESVKNYLTINHGLAGVGLAVTGWIAKRRIKKHDEKHEDIKEKVDALMLRDAATVVELQHIRKDMNNGLENIKEANLKAHDEFKTALSEHQKVTRDDIKGINERIDSSMLSDKVRSG